MSQAGIEDYSGYIDQLQVNADEFSALFNTILIIRVVCSSLRGNNGGAILVMEQHTRD